MRIESALPDINTVQIYKPQFVRNDNIVPEPVRRESLAIQYYSQGLAVEISKEARDAYYKNLGGDFNRVHEAAGKQQSSGMTELAKAEKIEGCQTCKSRRYVDVSNDASVSYQTPTHIAPQQAAGSVRAHEQEHVNNEQMKAQRDGRRVVSQSVRLTSSICPECGKPYISGGVTRTITAEKANNSDKLSVNSEQ